MSNTARVLRRAIPRLFATHRVALQTSRPLISQRAPLLCPKLTRFQSTQEQSQRPTISKEEPPKIYSYEDIKLLVNNPDSNKVIVDVREPVEFQNGSIPGAINIPYKSTPGALDLSPEEFEEAFKFPKPPKEKELIFYCLAGVRSTAAADLAQIFGYNKLGNYVGSYEDWVTHEQPTPPKDEQEESK